MKESSRHFICEQLGDLADEVLGGEPRVSGDIIGVVNTYGQVLGHKALFNCLNNRCLDGLSKLLELLVVIELGTVLKALSPCED